MVSPEQILFGIVLPLAIAALLTLIGGWISRGSSWGATLGLLIGFVLAFHAFLGQWPPIRTKEAPQDIGVVAVVIGVMTIALSSKRVPWFARGLLAITAPAAALWYVFKPLPATSIPQPFCQWMAALAGFAILTTASVEWVIARSGSAAGALTLGPLAAGAGLVIMLSGNNNFGLLGNSIAVMIFGMFVATVISGRASLSRGPALLVATLLGILVAWGYFDRGEITPTEMILLAAAPIAALIVELPPLHRWRAWKRELLRVGLISIPIAIAVVLAFIQFKKASAESSGLEM